LRTTGSHGAGERRELALCLTFHKVKVTEGIILLDYPNGIAAVDNSVRAAPRHPREEVVVCVFMAFQHDPEPKKIKQLQHG
jgi:hypothetical protein